MKKLPPVGSVVHVKWLDSGAEHSRATIPLEDESLFRVNSYGRLVHVNSERIVMESDVYSDDPTGKKVHFADRQIIAVGNIERVSVLEPRQRTRRTRPKPKSRRKR